MKKIVYLLVIIFLFSGCSSSKKASNKKRNHSTNHLEQTVENKQPYQSCAFKCKTSYNSIPVTITVRSTYDSIFWLSASSMGMEVVRAKCLKDSVYIINKLEKEYMQYSYSKLQVYLGMPVDYNFIEQLFLDTTLVKAYKTPLFDATITKKITSIDNITVPQEVNLVGTIKRQHQNISLKMSSYKFNLSNQYPFDKPKGYKVRK